MENTTLLIDEKEKENARALTQSFVRSDVKSRAYVNALGAEAWLKYLNDEGISSEKTYNMHNIRKILEEFDISDVILSNIHIDVRVVYKENEIFIPKSHFEFNITPDIYVVLKINKEYSETEFLGFFEPKMLNKNNANDEYYFIEKEKLSSPSDLKNFVENFKGNYDSDLSESDVELADSLIMSMSDNNISDEDKKTLLNYLKSNTGLRDRFIEFENFEMLSYQSVNTEEMKALLSGTVADTDVDEVADEAADAVVDESAEVSAIDNAFDESDFGAAPETEAVSVAMNDFENSTEVIDNAQVEDALDSFGETLTEETVENAEVAEVADADLESSLDEFAQAADTEDSSFEAALDEFSGNTEESDGNAIGDMLAGGAVLGAEIAGAAVASAAIAGSAEVIKDAAMAAEVAADVTEAVANVAEAANDLADVFSGEETNTVSDFVESTASDGLIDNIDIDALSKDAAAFSDALSETVEENKVEEMTDFANTFEETAEENNTEDVAGLEGVLDNFDTDMFNVEDASSDNLFETVENSSDIEVFSGDSGELEFSSGDNFDDGIVFEDNADSSVEFSAGGQSNSGSGGMNKGISTVVNTPISEATDLVSLEEIRDEMMQHMDNLPSEEPGALMDTMEMDEFNELVENYVPQELPDQSEVTEFSTIEKDVDENAVNTYVPSDMDASLFQNVDKSNSDDYVQAIPEESQKTLFGSKDDNITSENFVEEMPEEVEPTQYPSEASSDDFVEDMNDFMEGASEAETAGQTAEQPVQNEENVDSQINDEIDNPSSEETAQVDMVAAGQTLDESAVSLPEDVAPQELGEIGDINSDLFVQADLEATVQTDMVEANQTLDESAVSMPEDIAPQGLDEIGDINSDLFEQADLGATAQVDMVEANQTVDESAVSMPEDVAPQGLGEIEDIDSGLFDQADLDATAQVDMVEANQTVEESAVSMPEDVTLQGLGEIEDIDSGLFDQTDLEATVQPVSEHAEQSEVLSESVVETDELPLPETAEDVNFDEFALEDVTGNAEEKALEDVASISDIDEIAEESAPEIPVEAASVAESVLDDINDFSELSGLEALDAVAEVSSETEQIPEQEAVIAESVAPTIASGQEETGALGVLYSSENAPEQMVSPLPEELGNIEDYNDFKPKKNNIVLPIAAALIVTLIAGSIVGYMINSKNSVESETLIQASPENGTLANPETDNSGVLSDEIASNNGIQPAVPENPEDDLPEPESANVVAPAENDNSNGISQAAKQEAIKNTKNAINQTKETIKQNNAKADAPKKPLNANKTIALQKLSWEVPNYLSYSDNIKNYLQTAGKSIKLSLSSDLLLTSDYIYSNKVRVSLKLDNTGNIQSSQITQSSGSMEVDKIVLQTVKDTLNVVKPASGEVPTPTYNLGLIIYL